MAKRPLVGVSLKAVLLVVASTSLIAACGAVTAGPTASPTPRPIPSLLAGSPTASPALPSPAVLDLQQIRAEIESRYGGELISIGDGAGTVDVSLRSTAVAAAAELVARFGSKVDVTVGFFPYPAPSASTNPCLGGVVGAVSSNSLRATIEMPGHAVGHEGGFRAAVRLTNVGARPMAVSTGQPASIFLYQPGGTIPVGGYAGPVVGTGVQLPLAPKGSSSIPAAGGTSSCDLALGYELPDGPYVARAVVEIDDPSNGTASGVLMSEPFPIRVATP